MSKELYIELCRPEYNQRFVSGFYTESLGEGMSVVHESILGWFKPRFLMDHRSQEAYEFMDLDECFVNFTEADVEWNSLKGLSDDLLKRARRGYAGFPTHIGQFKDGMAEVSWEINPDGQYYMDDDGFGMTDDEEVTLRGTIDRQGMVVRKYALDR